MAVKRNGRPVGPLNTAVIKELRKLIDEAGLTQMELAEETGLPRPTIAKLLTGRTALDIGQLHKIAIVLQKRASEIVRDAEDAGGNVIAFPTPEPASEPEAEAASRPDYPPEAEDEQ